MDQEVGCYLTSPKETLIYSASGTKGKAHGAQKARHIMRIGELLSTAQRSISPAQGINQCFPKPIE